MSARVMPLAYATGICATHVRAADARTNERTDVDNYSPCEDILLLNNAREDEPIQVSLSPDDLHFIVTYDPERERSANRRDLVAVIEEIQALVNDGVIHPDRKAAESA